MKELDRKALIFSKTYGRCWYCGKEIDFFDCGPCPMGSKRRGKRTFCIDHVVPQYDFEDNDIKEHDALRQGYDYEYKDSLENLVPSCRACNSGKRHHPMERWRDVLAAKAIGAPIFSKEQLDWLRTNIPDFPLQKRAFKFYFETLLDK